MNERAEYAEYNERAEYLEKYRQRVNEYARRQLGREPPSAACAAERRQVAEEEFPDRNADPWGYLHAMAKVIAKHNPV